MTIVLVNNTISAPPPSFPGPIPAVALYSFLTVCFLRIDMPFDQLHFPSLGHG